MGDIKNAIKVINKMVQCPKSKKKDYVFSCEHIADDEIVKCQFFNRYTFIFNQFVVICNFPIKEGK